MYKYLCNHFTVFAILLAVNVCAHAQTTLDAETSTILGNIEWTTADSPYILTRDVEIREAGQLVIRPGVEIRFADSDASTSGNNANGIEIIVRGQLDALGTETEPVMFNGQNLPGTADHAIGIVFTDTALNSTLSYLQIEGLARGIEINGTNNVSMQGLNIDVAHTAFVKNSSNSDTLIVDSSFKGGVQAISLTPLAEDYFFNYNSGLIDGDVNIAGSQGFNSSIKFNASTLNGSLNIAGNLQPGASIIFENNTQINLGGIYVEGDITTSAKIEVNNSTVQAKSNGYSVKVDGSILANAEIKIENSSLVGHVKLGTSVSLDANFDGQYLLMTDASSWQDAQASCQAMGSRLADASSSMETELFYHYAEKSKGLMWVGGSLDDDSCQRDGDSFVEVDSLNTCSSFRDNGFSVRTVTRGKDCPCSNICSTRTQTNDNLCFQTNFACIESVSYEVKLPSCDAAFLSGAPCHGDDVNWSWSSQSDFDQNIALWAEGEADRLSCFSGDSLLSQDLHIAIDGVDNTGNDNGRFGLWRAQAGDQTYAYLCEGKLQVANAQDANRGIFYITNSSIQGDVTAHLGSLNWMQDAGSIYTNTGIHTYVLTSQAHVENIKLTGSFNTTSRTQVTLHNNYFMSDLLVGGGVFVEADMSTVTNNKVDGAGYGFVLRGPARVENNLITRNHLGLWSFPEEGPSPNENTLVVSNTFSHNNNGIRVSGSVNAPTTTLASNIVSTTEEGSQGMARIGANTIVTSHNNVFGYTTPYSNVNADAVSLNVNPGFVSDFPSDPINLRLDTGSPLIDQGSCDLVPALDLDGTPRPFDGDFNEQNDCDIGAYEFGPEEIFIYVDGNPIDVNSFRTGREVTLTAMGRRGGFIFPVSPVEWSFNPDFGVFNEVTGQFRPSAIPNQYDNALQITFGTLNADYDVNMSCGCLAPDDGSNGGGCNGVPDCYFDDWTCPVRENYCEISEIGSFEDPLVVSANSSKQIRAGARDSFGFVFRVEGTFTYEVVAGGGEVDANGVFTADIQAGDFANTLSISLGNFTGLSDVRIIPAAASAIVITADQQTIGTTQVLPYRAQVIDSYGNVINDADVEWSLVNAADSSIDTQTGRVTAGCIAGTFSQVVQASYQGVTARSDLIVESGGAPPASIQLIPPSLEIQATNTATFNATVTDLCNYTYPATNPVFTARVNAGVIDSQSGEYLASCNRGAFASAITVNADGLQTSAQVTIVDAPLERVRVQPENATIGVNSNIIFEAIGEDRCGRAQTVEPLWSSSIPNTTTQEFGISGQQQLNVGCSELGSYPVSVTARVVGVADAYANVVIIAGAVNQLDLADSQVTIPAGNEQALLASAKDACDNDRNDAIRWSSSSGSITEDGVYTAICVRGSYPDSVVVSAGGIEKRMSIDVIDGVLNEVVIEPSIVTIEAGGTRQLRANLLDGCQNLIEGEAVWTVAAGGVVTPEGLLTASVQARTYIASVVAEVNGFQDQADLTITPAAATSITINPSPVLRIEAGDQVTLEVVASDAFGNTFTPDALWTVNAAAGSIDDDNIFTATEVVGDFDNAVTAYLGDIEDSIDVDVIAGPVASLNIQPSPAQVQAGESLNMTATPVDRFGNAVNGAPIVWSVEGEGGIINANSGLFTASQVAGVYENSLLARSGDVESEVTISVLPNDPQSMQVIPSSPILTPGQSVQLSTQVFDNFGNLINATATYSIENGGASVSPSGLLTAGTVAGVYEDTLIVRSASQEQVISIIVQPGAPINIEINPARLSIEPLQATDLTATFVDAFDNEVNVEHVWTGFDRSGSITAEGRFTAGAVAGNYERDIVVRGAGLERFVDVEILAGPAQNMHIDPELITITPGSSLPLNVFFTDAQGNETESELEVSWSLRPNSLFSISADGVLSVDCEGIPGFYNQEVSAVAAGDVFRVSANIEVRAGETSYIEITPNRIETQVTGTAQLNAEGKDACGYDTLAVARWNVIQGDGTINPEGRFTADTLAETVVVRASYGNITADADIIVKPGNATRLTMTPNEISLTVDTRTVFTVEAADSFDNRWTPQEVEWTVTDAAAGNISEQGDFRAGEASGRYLQAIRATFQEKNATADVYLLADEPSTIDIGPVEANLIPGQVISFSTTITDRFGNIVEGAEAIFTCDPRVGSCTESGVLTATQVVGEYPESVTANVGAVLARADVFINNSDPGRIEIDPSSLTTTVGSLESLSATVYDTTGTVIEGASVEWVVEDPDLGSINVTPEGQARLSVGRLPNKYFSGITARIGQITGSADVLVPIDFDQDGIDDVDELDNNLDPRDESDALVDLDNDGLNNREEINAGLFIRDGDSDDDGIADGSEENWNADTDGDGTINALDADSDNDSIYDGTEIGLTQPHQDTDQGRGFFQADQDDQTQTDPLTADSDRDGLSDGEEDSNQNGRVDPGETSPIRDFNFITCDATLETTGCPEDLVCVDSVCVEPNEEEEAPDDDGCEASSSQTSYYFFAMLCLVFALRRRFQFNA
jgi:hypothetical protein